MTGIRTWLRVLLTATLGVTAASGTSGAEVAKVYWSAVLNGSTSVIQRADPDGSHVETVLSGAGIFTSPAIDVVHGKIYWCQYEQTPFGDRRGKLQRANLDGSGVEDVVPGLFSPFGLALDVPHETIYWVDGQSNKVQRAQFDGSNVQDLVVGLSDPVSIALDLADGTMYWTDFGNQTLSRANLDGSQRQTLLAQQPWLATVVLAGAGPAKQLYLADNDNGGVRRANPDGSALVLLVSGVTSPTGVAVDLEGNRLYINSFYGQRLRRAALDGSGLQTIATLATQPGGIALLPVTCGSGTIEAGEACDDGNRASGDCCSASCQLEPPTVVCRSAAGACDLTETCTGTSATCPADTKRVGPCRAAAGTCDIVESCDGVSDACPADALVAAGSECRAAGGVCDVAEACTGGSPLCPSDTKRTTTCRPAAGTCDVAESCDGLTDDCPTDAFLATGVVCRAAAGACDVTESCTGSAPDCPADTHSTAVCRPAAGACDVAELCDGAQVDCPADANADDGTDCSDGAFCNGSERCAAGACQPGARPCTLLCNEGDDRCETGCLPGPMACRTAGNSTLKLANETADDGDRLTWKWSRGDATSQLEFGDPTDTANYAVCLYAGDAGALIGQAVIPASADHWSSLGSKGYRYRNPAGDADGIATVIVSGSTQRRAKILVKGRGTGLPDPALPLAAPVLVQLVNGDNGQCWGSAFDGASLRTNDAHHLRAQVP